MSNKKYLWSFYFDCGRSGGLEGLFVATEEEVEYAIGKYASFGEALGKHSDVYGNIKEGDISKVDISPEAVAEVSAHLGNTWSGYNPLHYIHHQCQNVIDDEQCEETANPDDMYEIEGKFEYLCYDCYNDLKEQDEDSESY